MEMILCSPMSQDAHYDAIADYSNKEFEAHVQGRSRIVLQTYVLDLLQSKNSKLKNSSSVQSDSVHNFDTTDPENTPLRIMLDTNTEQSIRSKIHIIDHTGECLNDYCIHIHAPNSGGAMLLVSLIVSIWLYILITLLTP